MQRRRGRCLPTGISCPSGLPRAPKQLPAPPAEQTPQLAAPHTPQAPSPALTLDDLVQIASSHNPTLVQASMAVRAVRGRYVQAGLYPNPTVAYVGDEIGNDGAGGLNGAAFGQEIVTNGKLRFARAAASCELQQAIWALEAQQYRVLNDVRAGYYEVLLAQRLIDANRQLVHIGVESARVTEQLLLAKAVAQPEVLQARIEADRASLSLADAEHRQRGAWQRLTAMLGQPHMQERPLAGQVDADLPQLDRQECLATILARSPQVARAQAGVTRAHNELACQIAARHPNFEVETAVKYDTGSDFTVADVGLAVPLPLFDRNQGRVLEAQAHLRAASNEVRRIELELCNRFATVFQEYAVARQHVETHANSILPNAKRSLELTTAAYREGEYDYLALLTAQRTYFSASLDYLNSLHRLWARSIEIEGLLLTGGLEWDKYARTDRP